MPLGFFLSIRIGDADSMCFCLDEQVTQICDSIYKRSIEGTFLCA